MRIVPYMPLSMTTVMLAMPCCTAVAISCPDIRKSPSPAMQSAIASGRTRLAMIAAGTP